MSLIVPPSAKAVDDAAACAAFVAAVSARSGRLLVDAKVSVHWHPEDMRYGVRLEYGPADARRAADVVVDGLEATSYRGRMLDLAVSLAANEVDRLEAHKPPMPEGLVERVAAMSESDFQRALADMDARPYDFKNQMLADFEPAEQLKRKLKAASREESRPFVAGASALDGLAWVFDGLMRTMPWLGLAVFRLAFIDIASGGQPALRRWQQSASEGHAAVVRHVASLQPSLQVPPSPDTIASAVSAAEAWLASRPRPECVVVIDDEDEDEA